MEELIRRSDAIKQIVNTPTLNQNKGQEYLEGSATRQNEIIDILKSLPSVAPSRPSGEWIPCNERLPEDGRYLCDYGDCIDFGRITNGEWYVSGVVAWMPLPKPHKEGADE
jgi:hypothetical protein